MHIETNPDGEVALARIAMTNGAQILENAAGNPALDNKYRDAALALAGTYRTMAATGSFGDPAKFDAAVDDTNTKDRIMEGLCGG
ncbi:hypothetical protein [Mycolicibacter terrae]|nr:hypothetical protein [Mycolicibacter terrae]